MKPASFVYFLIISPGYGLILSTYNIWNTMFNWQIRKLRVLEMIHTTESDIIALQEVRSGEHPQLSNQILELKSGLPSQFKWHVFRVANNVSFIDKTIDKSYPGEGIGIISRLPIIDSSTHYLLPHPADPDKNKRVIVHVRVKDRDGTSYDILVVHLSYHRQQQCRNVADIVTFITSRRLRNVIIMGDFNTYNDYNWPIDIFLDGKVTKDNPCWKISQNVNLFRLKFKDAWLNVNAEKSGLTFSNMPSPGFESRPDRILVESKLSVKNAKVIGNGERYKQRYKAAVHWSRFTTVIQSAYLSYQGVEGYPCSHDCGPHGSCQCGVCVAIGNKKDCLLPYCDNCISDVLENLVLHFIIFVIVLFHLFYSVVLILTIGANSYGDTLHSILGFKCCLFNPKLCKFSGKTFGRKQQCLKFCQMWPLFWFPPYIQFFGCLIILYSFSIYTKRVFKPVLDLTYTVLEEELFPSDHLMVVAHVVKE
ncbi:uncharacterized protein LOC132737690 isoform X1 [Ruditapes philippinarum]|uniref:uncharacterized protein LOC132737690 isoform X1 n=1 Tax=Ruditapes philippinarum TaxID=129788 RepID=UPI00295C06A3|nr:uncharacterized protein LOC132737690 isoform X1 [Ruditapes philippinarum]